MTDNGVQKTPYPFVYEFTSHEYEVETLEQFHSVISYHAAQGDCVLKGILGRPLVRESRAGSTDSRQRTSWVCLDLDGVDGFENPDDFMRSIGCGNVDYVLQWSSSHGIGGFDEMRCHIFVLLSEEATPEYLKRWLQTLNLTNPVLSSQLQLTRTNSSLRWALDITTCQNDKLLYIASPTFEGMDDPLQDGARIELIKRRERTLVLPTDVLETPAIRAKTDAKINELRERASMPKRKTRTKILNDVEYAVAPDECSVTDIKAERGFVYLNLNGGDSWGYYHPEDNPQFIYNFKGEPAYKTEELLPEYWIEVNKQRKEQTDEEIGKIYLAFRDLQSSVYYNGWFDLETKELVLPQARSEKQLRDFLATRYRPVPEFIPDWDIVYDPHSDVIVDKEGQTVNIFRKSECMLAEQIENPELPPVCAKIISHVLGNDQACIDHFINWLACVFQYRDRTGTAWILRGCQGTGKGLLFNNIITPLLGESNTVAKRMEELESEFTGFLANKLLTSIDEFELGATRKQDRITAKLKNLIVEPTISIRAMYREAYMSRNYNNMIFSSNKDAATHVSPDDRRYNVSPYQENKLVISTAEIEDILPEELLEMYSYLMAYPADRDLARTPLVNEARDSLISVSTNAVDTISSAVLGGNFEFFWDLLPSEKPPETGVIGPNHYSYERYRALLIRLLEAGPEGKLSRDDLHVMFKWADDNTTSSANKFTSMLKHHRIFLTPTWINGRTVRGIEVTWSYPTDTWVTERLDEIKRGIV